ncbi:unnamed protein product [Peronospora belbahrii]|uniref:Uncharacterized protein n=1 Tax=Peronospora belbahrii TaxID=622444 RepID=A0AAU9L8Z4_9STRA|nr:unnamed protein product [Peronospora belbahrii]CAH0513781.1 unnamed protein product [Peronospora belbahrii]
MTTSLNKCLKLHKLFVAEVTRSSRLESEGSQVLSSLANVSQRIPRLLQYSNTNHHDNETSNDNVEMMGVLSYCNNTQALLLQKHFLSLEKSRTFLIDIMREYQEVLRHLRSFASECMTLVDHAFIESESTVNGDDEMTSVTFPLQLQEWMETVVAMFEHEVIRKITLVTDLEYSDSKRLNDVQKQWSSKGVMGNIDNDYVQTGLRMPQARSSNALQSGGLESSDASKSKKKKKKKSKARK